MGSIDLWYVKLPSGDVHRVTLDQLDEAYQRGQVDLRTQVMGASTERWMTLAEILSDEEPELPTPPRAQPIAYQHVPQTPYSLRPMSVDFEDVEIVPPKRGRGGRWALAAIAIAAAVAGVGVYRPDLRASAVARGATAVARGASAVAGIEARVRCMSAARTQTVAAASPVPAVPAAPPAVAAPLLAAVPPAAPPAPTTIPVAAAAIAAAPAANASSSTPVTAAGAAVASGNAAQANLPTPPSRHTKIQHRPAAAARAKTRVVGGNHGSQVFTTGGSKFDPLSSSI